MIKRKANPLLFYGLIAIIIFLILSYSLYGNFKLGDDTYIYLKYAKNVIDNSEISFNFGARTYGFTSPLWLFLIVLLQLILKNMFIIPHTLSLFFSVLTILPWIAIINTITKKKSLKIFFLLLIVLDPNLLKHSFLGMEASLSYFLSSLIIFFLLKIYLGNIYYYSLIITLSVYTLVRPESIILSFFTFIFLVITNKPTKKTIIYSLILVSIIILPWHIFAYNYFGFILPTTFNAKAIDYTIGKNFFVNIFDTSIIFLGNYFLLFVLVVTLMIREKLLLIKFNSLGKLFLLNIFSLILFYSLTISNEQVFARYYCIAFPFLFYIIFVLIEQFDTKQELNFYIKTIVLISFLFLSIFFSYLNSLSIQSDYTEDKIVDWVKKNTLKSDLIVRGRIGKIGFLSERKILDPVGLINPEISYYYKNKKISNFYFNHKPSYYIGDTNSIKAISKFAKLVTIKKEFRHDFPNILRDYFKNNTNKNEYIYQLKW